MVQKYGAKINRHREGATSLTASTPITSVGSAAIVPLETTGGLTTACCMTELPGLLRWRRIFPWPHSG